MLLIEYDGTKKVELKVIAQQFPFSNFKYFKIFLFAIGDAALLDAAKKGNLTRVGLRFYCTRSLKLSIHLL